jgi:uncharacterized protein (TIGR02246 family)
MRTVLTCLNLLLLTMTLTAQNAADEAAIQKLVNTMADSWTAGDGEGFASVFADGHDFVVWNGYYLKDVSRKMNAQSHQQLFDTQYKNSEHHSTVDKIRFIREDLAMIHVFAAVVDRGAGRPKDPQVLWTGLLEKKEGEWKIISFHNLDLEVFQNEELRKTIPMPAEVMYAGWYNKQ